MDAWMDGWMDACMHAWMDAWMDGEGMGVHGWDPINSIPWA